jgi:hypothetical protein
MEENLFHMEEWLQSFKVPCTYTANLITGCYEQNEVFKGVLAVWWAKEDCVHWLYRQAYLK